MDTYFSRIPSQYIAGSDATGYSITDPAYAAAYGEIRKYFSSGLAGGNVTYSAFHQMNPYVDLSPLAQSLFIDQALIDKVNDFNARAVEGQNDAYVQGNAMEASRLAHSGEYGTGFLDNTVLGQTVNTLSKSTYDVITGHATLKDIAIATLPFDPVILPAVAPSLLSAAAPLTSALAAIPAGLGSVVAAVSTFLNKGKDFIQTTVDKVKDVLGGAKLPELGNLGSFKLPDLSGLKISGLGDLGKISIPSGLKDALSGVIPAHPAPLQFQEAPAAKTVDLPSVGPSPVLLAGGVIGLGVLVYLWQKK